MNRHTKLASLGLLSWALVPSVSAFAQGFPEHDVTGSKDDPIVSRYPGSLIVGYFKKTFDETDLFAGPYKDSHDGKTATQTVHVEGAITRIVYVFPHGGSAVEVMKNYTDAFRKANMTIVFNCEKNACGTTGGNSFSSSFRDAKLSPELEHWDDWGNAIVFVDGFDQYRYVLAKGTGSDGAITYVAVFVVPPSDGNGGILVEIAKAAPMQSGQVTVNLSAADMEKSISADGRVALYGLQFDTDKTELRADSKPSLVEIAKLLTQDPKLDVYVVGHTDNQGSYAHNLDLSQKRSEAIVQALTTQYKIAPGRLTAKGVASLAPIASNETDAGRAKNRRVELVKQ
jgi:outer membrane protein OmpA-like peptidoglycan-associated protein